jgi:DNA-binding winged helix-turn-helix (wHTH) protein
MKQTRIRFEAFELNLYTGELSKAGNRVLLQDQPTRLLTLLANRPGELVTRDEIQRELWKDGEFVEFEHAVNTAIRKIRVALEDTTDSPRIIETLPRKGYRFIAPVDVLEFGNSTEHTIPNPANGHAPSNHVSAAEESFVLPISTTSARMLFLLAQIPYVASYLAVFYHWNNLDEALIRAFLIVPVDYSRFCLQMMALIGFAVRIYLIGLVAWGHTDSGPRYRKLFPFLLALDGLWAATPLLVQTAGPLIPWAGLILMGWLVFGQRTLMRAIEQNQQPGIRTSAL